MLTTSRPTTTMLQCLAESGVLAGALSTAALAWRGKRDTGSGIAALNAPSHWLWGREAIDRNEPSLKHTGVGVAVHWASGAMWALLYAALRARRREPTAVGAVAEAAAVTAVAAVVDLKLVPHRLTPGFQERLERRSLGWVYAGFGLGLALAGLHALRR